MDSVMAGDRDTCYMDNGSKKEEPCPVLSAKFPTLKFPYPAVLSN
jgi:hypothetical protein